MPDAVTPGDVSALVAFQATLPPPTVKTDLPDDWRVAAAAGEKQFDALGCASCHVADAAAEIADLHRSRALRHGGHAARGRSQEGDRDRPFADCPFAQDLAARTTRANG